jgi:hypothetical protein
VIEKSSPIMEMLIPLTMDYFCIGIQGICNRSGCGFCAKGIACNRGVSHQTRVGF